MGCTGGDVAMFILCFFLPPLAVFLSEDKVGKACGAQFVINILLCLLIWIPGVIHACFVVMKNRGRTVVVVAPPPGGVAMR